MNKSFLMLCILFSLFAGLFAQQHKIVGLVAGRNESAIISQCLKGLSLYTDAIVYFDDASEDDSVDIVKNIADCCKIERIIEKKSWLRDEPGDKNLLLKAGREIGGTHFIVLDADELFTANCRKNNVLRNTILKLEPGTNLRLGWIYLWKDSKHYRSDELPFFTNHYKCFIFCDDGVSNYNSAFIHTERSPFPKAFSYEIPLTSSFGVLHFEFMNWRNQLIKNVWYQCLERIREPEKKIEDITRLYQIKKYTGNVQIKETPKEWLAGYDFFDESAYMKPDQWRRKQIAEWFSQYGKNYFAQLDIWNADMQAAIKLDF